LAPPKPATTESFLLATVGKKNKSLRPTNCHFFEKMMMASRERRVPVLPDCGVHRYFAQI
jgi:hypothetical protein